MTLGELLPLVAIAAVLWLLIIRPAFVRRKAQVALMASLEPGQQVMTTAGVFGTVVSIDGERISLQIAPGVVIDMLAVAVAKVMPADPDQADLATPRDEVAAAEAPSGPDADLESDRG